MGNKKLDELLDKKENSTSQTPIDYKTSVMKDL